MIREMCFLPLLRERLITHGGSNYSSKLPERRLMSANRRREKGSCVIDLE